MLKSLSLDMNTMKSEIEELKKDKIIKDQKISELENDKIIKDKKINDLVSDKIIKDKKINDLVSDKIIKDREINDLESDKASKDLKIKALEQDMKDIKADKNSKDRKISDFESDKTSKDQKIGKLVQAIKRVIREKKDLNEKITFLGNRITAEKQNLEATLNFKMTSIGNRITTEKMYLDRKLTKIENKPYAFQCAYKTKWTAANSVITWDKLTIDSMSRVTGGFNLSTGEFTVGKSGVWEVTFSMVSPNASGQGIYSFLFINGRKLTESEYGTSYHNSKGWVKSLGSRTLFMELNQGDKVTLQTAELTGDALWQSTLCFHLALPL